MNLGRSATKKEMMLFGVLMLALLNAIPRFAYKPFSKIIADNTQKIANMEMEKTALINFTATTPTLEKTETLHAKGIKMKVLLGEIQSDYAEVTSLLNSLTDRNFLKGIDLEKLAYQSPNYEEGYSKTQFAMQLSGLFPDLVQYVERLEQFPALFNIDELTLKSAQDKELPEKIEVIVQGYIYRFEKNPNKPNDAKGDAKSAPQPAGGGKS